MKKLNEDQDIYIFEGPAGSGKTTMVKKVHQKYGAEVIEWTGYERPRSYGGIEGELLAITKDLNRWELALTRFPHPVILDRFCFSGYVYNLIRQGVSPSEESFHKYMNGFTHLITGARWLLVQKGFLPSELPATIHWIINLPPVEVILERRTKCGKFYPYSVQEEYDHYGWLVDYLRTNDMNSTWLEHVYVSDGTYQEQEVEKVFSEGPF